MTLREIVNKYPIINTNWECSNYVGAMSHHIMMVTGTNRHDTLKPYLGISEYFTLKTLLKSFYKIKKINLFFLFYFFNFLFCFCFCFSFFIFHQDLNTSPCFLRCASVIFICRKCTC